MSRFTLSSIILLGSLLTTSPAQAQYVTLETVDENSEVQAGEEIQEDVVASMADSAESFELVDPSGSAARMEPGLENPQEMRLNDYRYSRNIGEQFWLRNVRGYDFLMYRNYTRYGYTVLGRYPARCSYVLRTPC